MSITNARQYRITKAQIARFEQAIEAEEKDLYTPRSRQEAEVHDILLEQARQQVGELREELQAYEKLAGSLSVDGTTRSESSQ